MLANTSWRFPRFSSLLLAVPWLPFLAFHCMRLCHKTILYAPLFTLRSQGKTRAPFVCREEALAQFHGARFERSISIAAGLL